MNEPKTWQQYMRLMRRALRAMRVEKPYRAVVTIKWDPKTLREHMGFGKAA